MRFKSSSSRITHYIFLLNHWITWHYNNRNDFSLITVSIIEYLMFVKFDFMVSNLTKMYKMPRVKYIYAYSFEDILGVICLYRIQSIMWTLSQHSSVYKHSVIKDTFESQCIFQQYDYGSVISYHLVNLKTANFIQLNKY